MREELRPATLSDFGVTKTQPWRRQKLARTIRPIRLSLAGYILNGWRPQAKWPEGRFLRIYRFDTQPGNGRFLRAP